MATTKRLVRANGTLIKMDGAVFLKRTLGDPISSQMVYVTPHVTGFFICQKVCKELLTVFPVFPSETIGTGQN